ncbi:MBL fold metallo-hydrolase [Tepidamorphus sp. 3E244]|uniref:MBL fold metallo-hydrolase n=1 Tax=Tepidamorphus sp. 3E244 TaxID=3385498 RepID=UPI0038FC3C2D
MPAGEFSLRFWGVRGSIATCAPDICGFGGETICMEVTCGDRTLVFDAGSGVRRLGKDLLARDIELVDLFISHFHYDHVEGLPFFAPMYREGARVRIHSGHGAPPGGTRSLIEGFIGPPYFPICPELFRAEWSCANIALGEVHDIGDDISLETFALNHPGGATGYRITYAEKSIAIVTDNEHVIGQTDDALGRFISGADLVIYDAMYTDAELPTYVGFGHSTWQEGARLATAFNADQLALIHHSPHRLDTELENMDADLAAKRPNSFFARQGQRIVLA